MKILLLVALISNVPSIPVPTSCVRSCSVDTYSGTADPDDGEDENIFSADYQELTC